MNKKEFLRRCEPYIRPAAFFDKNTFEEVPSSEMLWREVKQLKKEWQLEAVKLTLEKLNRSDVKPQDVYILSEDEMPDHPEHCM